MTSFAESSDPVDVLPPKAQRLYQDAASEAKAAGLNADTQRVEGLAALRDAGWYFTSEGWKRDRS